MTAVDARPATGHVLGATDADRAAAAGGSDGLDRLTTLDASFLWFERPGSPVHVGAVATFEAAPLLDEHGELRLADLRARIAARLDLMPRLRRRLATVPFDLGRPVWVDDPDFDIARHVRAVRAPEPGDDDALRTVAERIQGEVLPRDRPLWDLHVVTGLDHGRIGLVERIHHALVDGVSGVDLATILLDLEPDAPQPPARPWRPAAPPTDVELVGDSVREALAGPVRLAGAAVRSARRPLRTLRGLADAGRGLATMAERGLFAPATSLNAPGRGGRRLAWTRADLDGVRLAAKRAGGTVNDVVLAAVGGGLRAVLLARGEPLPTDLVLKVLVPVSVRADHEHGALGNRVGMIDAPLPVGIGDPDERLAEVVATMARLKARPAAPAVDAVLRGADLLPAPVARALVWAMGHQPLINLVVTNVPGPPGSLYAAGARMLEAFPVVPLSANLTVGVAVLSYGGALTVTVTTDASACPHADVFAAGVERALAAYVV